MQATGYKIQGPVDLFFVSVGEQLREHKSVIWAQVVKATC